MIIFCIKVHMGLQLERSEEIKIANCNIPQQLLWGNGGGCKLFLLIHCRIQCQTIAKLQRNNEDCWLDEKLVCQEYELDFEINTDWFVSALHGPRYGMTSRWCWITPFVFPCPHSNSKVYSKVPSCPRFGGDYLAIIGACQCDVGVWDDHRLECKVGGQVKEFSIQYRECQVYRQVKESCNILWDHCIAEDDSGFAFVFDVSISYLKAEEDSHVLVNGDLSWCLQFLQC